jgi:hypothetical protein
MNTETTTLSSLSVDIGPRDSRCRYWAKIIRADDHLPLPSAVSGANDVPGRYCRTGDDELGLGDVLIEGEENHHRKQRGWTYRVTWYDPAMRPPEGHCVVEPSTNIKMALKGAGMALHLLSGSGDVAACIRIVHALRADQGGIVLGNA